MFLKKLLATAIICFYTNVFFAKAQNLYQDAVTLSEWNKNPVSNQNQLEKIAIILNKIHAQANDSEKVCLVDSTTYLGSIRKKFLTYSNVFILEYNKDTYDSIRPKILKIDDKKTQTELLNTLSRIVSTTIKIKNTQEQINLLKNDAINRDSPVVSELWNDAKKCQGENCQEEKMKLLVFSRINELKENVKKDSTELVGDENNFKDRLQKLKTEGETIKALLSGKISSNSDQILKEYKSVAKEIIGKEQNERQNYIYAHGKDLTNLGMPSQSQIIDGISMYLANRVKQEAIIFFVEKLKAKLVKKDSIKKDFISGLDKIIPETAKKFRKWDELSVPNFDDSWKYAFSKDLINLPSNGFEYLKKQNKDSLINEMHLEYIQDAVTISSLIVKKNNWIDIAEQLAKTGDLNASTRKLKSDQIHLFMRLMYIINTEMYSPDTTSNYWISSNTFDHNKENIPVFLNLILAKYPDIKYYLKQDITKLDPDAVYIRQMQNWLSGVLIALEALQKNHYPTKKEGENGFDINSYWLSVSALMDQTLFDGTIEGESPVLNVLNDKKNLDNVRGLFETYQLIQNKNYAAAAESCIAIFKSYQKDENNEALNEAAKLVSFFSAILQSKSNEDVQAAVQSFALPISSYRLKRVYKSSITVGAYFGGYGGAEFIKGGQTAGVVGLSAPISLDFNWRTGKTSYLTLSFIGLDLGAAVSYRLRSSGEGLPKEVRWSQFFSPGLNLRVSLANSPVTFSFGGQLTPELRDFNNSVRNDAIRTTAGIMIDMPLLLLKRKEQPLKIGAKKSKKNANSNNKGPKP